MKGVVCPVDLHAHTCRSDGSLTPTEFVDLAIQKGLKAVAITDHDTVDGLDEAIKYAADKDIELIPGIELSTSYLGRDVHIVGLYIDYHNEAFKAHLTNFLATRDLRNMKMCKKLHDEAGLDISFEEVTKENPDCTITRSHIAKYLLKHGQIKSIKEGFDRYLNDRSKYYVPRELINPSEAVNLILECGGIPVLAHPVLYGLGKEKLDTLVGKLKEAGLIGIEAIYCTYTPSDERDIKALAAKYELCLSGGSDYHGAVKPGLELGNGYGKLFVPETVLDDLKARKPYRIKTV